MASEEKRVFDDCFPFAVAHGDMSCDPDYVDTLLDMVKDR